MADIPDGVHSYKFHRLFPLSQYDLPTHNPSILSFPTPTGQSGGASSVAGGGAAEGTRESQAGAGSSASRAERAMSQEQITKNPGVDYTR